MSASIVIADDHDVVRMGLRAILESRPEFEVAGEASNGVEAIEAVESLKPDILVLDLEMPELGGLEVLDRIRCSSPETRTIVFSMHGEEEYALRSLRSGAAGYITKLSGAGELIKAIQEAIAGRRYFNPPLPGI